ncbi:MAG: hypothetical protein J0J01_26615 [Reyranella sp.]|uniref:hypothetical protein n=1 Tax=Reyranella sp. TaxID=1929291 RepID=UPI001ACF59E4|nr:hypothetical protein [Reyranella sp.]MBN9090500.1 hypothetical protein [Reyranella sp.]
MPNTRIRGKIPHSEWPKIALRFQKGETLAKLARSYGCTAPAIRYIVARISARDAKLKMGRDKSEMGTLLASPVGNRRTTRIGGKEDPPDVVRGGLSSVSPTRDIWGRINSDMAMFLAAMDSLSSDDSVSNYEALLAATDRLLWATARTRLEIERILDNRKQTPIRRTSG